MEDINKNRIGLMRSITVLTAIIISCTIFMFNYKQDLKYSENEVVDTETQILDVGDVNAIEAVTENSLSTFTLESVNNIFRNSTLAFTDQNNLKTINISTVEVLGYLSTNEDNKLVLITGTYSCLDNTDTCNYAEEKTIDTYKLYVTFNKNSSGEYYISTFNDTTLQNDINYISNYSLLQ